MQVWRHVGRDLEASGSRKGERGQSAPGWSERREAGRRGWGGHAGKRWMRQEDGVEGPLASLGETCLPCP